jgi:glycosyltransferase involved in cell wall biosynthesis
MKKILILHTSTVMGGAEYSLLEFLRNLDNIPRSIHIAYSSQQVLFQHIKLLSICVHDIYLPYLNKKHMFKIWIEIIRASFKFYQLVQKEKIQVVYCNTFRSLPFCLFIKWFCKLKIVCHCRDHISSRLVRFMIRIMADECVAVSNIICRELPRSSKTHIIYNSVNPLLFHKNDTSKFLIARYHLPSDTCLIGNIGQIVSWKNQMDYLFVAEYLLRNHKNLHFFLIGAIVDYDYFLILKQQIYRLGLEPHVTFTGYVESITEYLSGFTVVLHTAHNEPFGRVLIETAASAKPVVTYASGGPSEIIENEKTGFLVRDGDIETMAKLTVKLLDNPNLQTNMGQSAREHIIRHFNSKDYARKIYQILVHD